MSSNDTQNASAELLAFHAQINGLIGAGDDQKALELAESSLGNPLLRADATCAMAAIYYRAGAIGYAIKMLSGLAEEGDHSGDLPEILAVLYCLAGCVADALYYAKLSTTERQDDKVRAFFGPTLPGFADAFAQISAKPLLATGIMAMNSGDLDLALFRVEQHLHILPNDVEALDAYAQIKARTGDIPAAIAMLRSVTTLAGASATLLGRLGHCLIQTGQFHEGLACHHEAVARAPKSPAILGAAVADLAYFSEAEAAASGIPARWIEQVAAAAPKTVRPAPKYVAGGQVRICYLCSSLTDESLRSMVGAVARCHDRARFTVIGFGAGEADSPQNAWTRGAFDVWRDVASLDVATLGALIRGEGVNVVIDVDGMLAPARAGLFQRNTAPVQVGWLHAPVSGRVPGNYLACVPGAAEGDGVLALPFGRYCLGDPSGARPSARPAPSSSGQGVVFGAELTRAQLNPRLAMVWGRIVQSVPGSMLLFRDTGLFNGADAVDALIALFGNAGMAHRVDVIKGGTREEFAAGIDMALMPFPSSDILAHGELLRHGVPVVALAAGQGADMGAFLTAAGLGEQLVAGDVDGYVAAACRLAGDGTALAGIRAALPERLSSVPAYTAAGFARALEEAVVGALSRLGA